MPGTRVMDGEGGTPRSCQPRDATSTWALMKGGRGEVWGREAAIREPRTFDVHSPPPR